MITPGGLPSGLGSNPSTSEIILVEIQRITDDKTFRATINQNALKGEVIEIKSGEMESKLQIDITTHRPIRESIFPNTFCAQLPGLSEQRSK